MAVPDIALEQDSAHPYFENGVWSSQPAGLSGDGTSPGFWGSFNSALTAVGQVFGGYFTVQARKAQAARQAEIDSVTYQRGLRAESESGMPVWGWAVIGVGAVLLLRRR